MTATDFTAAVAQLLSVPRPEGTFRVRDGRLDVTDEFSELRFRDPRLGGYLDRTRIEAHLSDTPLTLWIRGSWADNREGIDTAPERNRWTLVVPPGAELTVTGPRRSFTVVRAVVGTFTAGRPFASRGKAVTGRTVELTAAPSGLIAQLDWLAETPEVSLAQSTGMDLSDIMGDWHTAPLPDLIARVGPQVASRRPARGGGAPGGG